MFVVLPKVTNYFGLKKIEFFIWKTGSK